MTHQKAREALVFIEGLRDDLHNRRVADWYPEGANNAALQMSEDMRLIGNRCAEFLNAHPDAPADGAGLGEPVAHVDEGARDGIRWTTAGVRADLPNGTGLVTHSAALAFAAAEVAREREACA